MTRRRLRAPAQARCVLDSGGVTALIGHSARAREWLRWIVQEGGVIVVPVPVLAEIITGNSGRDAEINRILNVLGRGGSVLRGPDEKIGRTAGQLRFRAGTDDGIDALVAAEAAEAGTPCVLLTSDPDDMSRLVGDAKAVVVRPV